MDFARFATGAMAAVGGIQYMYGHEFVLNLFTILAVVEQVDFIWRIIDVGLLKCYSMWWQSANENVLLAGGDVDISTVALLVLLFFIFPNKKSEANKKEKDEPPQLKRRASTGLFKNTNESQRGWIRLALLCCVGLPTDAVILMGLEMFKSMWNSQKKMYEHNQPQTLILISFFLALLETVLWIYLTIRTLNEMPQKTFNGLYKAFVSSGSTIHGHRFWMIFVLSWYMFGVILTIQPEQLFNQKKTEKTSRMTFLIKALLSILLVLNIAPVIPILWFIFKTGAHAPVLHRRVE
jgi:hypothetical protein